MAKSISIPNTENFSQYTLDFEIDPEQALSMSYYSQALDQPISSKFRAKKLGQFYTPPSIGQALATKAVAQLEVGKNSYRIVDPFCGDGRLLVAAAHAIRNRPELLDSNIILIGYDIDPVAIENARHALSLFIKDNPEACVYFELHEKDYFLHEAKQTIKADICITNPPWLLLKVSKSDKDSLSLYIDTLNMRFPESKNIEAFSSKSVNLARIGLISALQSVAHSGILAILLPASILADSASAKVRETLFSRYNVLEIETFSASIRVFDGVDQDFCSVVVINDLESPKYFKITRHLSKGRSATENYSSLRDSGIMGSQFEIYDVVGQEAAQLLNLLNEYKELRTHSGISIFRELDETRVGEKFTVFSDAKFIKGRNVQRFSHDSEALPFIKEEFYSGISSISSPKVVWRDVSRRSQYRRMQAALVQPGYIAGNSLGCLSVDTDSLEALYYYLGFMNSWLAEIQVRSMSHTNHVSSGVVRRLRFPEFNNENNVHIAVSRAAKNLTLNDSKYTQRILDELILHTVDLTRDALSTILTGLDRND